jgi:hypothetical protein
VRRGGEIGSQGQVRWEAGFAGCLQLLSQAASDLRTGEGRRQFCVALRLPTNLETKTAFSFPSFSKLRPLSKQMQIRLGLPSTVRLN